jgi:chitodextrinase
MSQGVIRRLGLSCNVPPPSRTRALLVLLVVSAVALTSLAQAAPAASRSDRTPPSIPGPLVVTLATQSSITLTWLPATDDDEVAEYGVYWNTRRPQDMERTENDKPTFTKTALSCGASYTVEVVAFDASGNHSRETSDAVVSTAACGDTSAPTAPAGITQIARTQSTATIAWKPSSDNVGVAGYAVTVGGVQLGTTAGSSYTVTGLTCESWYTAVVQAYDAAGNRSVPVSFQGSTAACADRTAPPPPSDLSQASRTTSSMGIRWKSSSGAARYGVYVDGSRLTQTTSSEATVSALACDKTYAIGVDAVDAAGNRSAPTTAQMATAPCSEPPSGGHGTVKDTVAPSTPAALNVTTASSSSIGVRWSASSDNVGVVGYRVYTAGATAGDTTGTTFLVPALRCGSSVLIGVEALDAAGNRSQRATISAATAACVDEGAPTMPGAVTLQNRTETSITYSWAPSTDAVGVAGYGIWVDGKLVDTTTERQYTVSGLTCSGIYTIGVDAFDAEGNRSATSATLLATTPCEDLEPPTTPSGLVVSNATASTLNVAWQQSRDDVGVAGYDVYVADKRVLTTTKLLTTLSGLACNTSINVGVEAFDAAGNRSARIAVQSKTAACGTTSGSLYLAPNGSDSSSCTLAAPCASLNRAYQLAAPGAVVSVAAGSYPAQTIARDPSKTSSSEVVFAASGSVTLAGFTSGDSAKTETGAKHFELRGFRVNGYVALNWGTEDVTLSDVDAPGFDLTSVKDVRVIGGDYGPMVDGVSHINACGISGCYPSQDVLIDGASFHDYTITYAEKHSECLMIWPGKRVTIRNSSFRNCTDFDVLVKPYNTALVGLPGDIVMENNVFDEPIIGDGCFCTRGGNAIGITQGGGESWGNVNIRYNSALGGIRVDPAITNATVKGNVGRKDQASSCQSNVSFSYNVWSGTSCSSTDRVQALTTLFVGAFDLRLQAGGAAVNAGDPKDYPATDRVGTVRPLGGAPDAGAYELG